MFFEHLLSCDGGVEKHDQGLEHMRRVGRLLYEVQDPPKDVELLWRDESVTAIRDRFFDGNHLLTEPREPGTLLAYIASLRMFYKFIKGRRTGVSALIPMNSRTISNVDETLVRIDNWSKSLRESINARKRVVQQENLENMLLPKDISELICGKRSKRMVREFMRLVEKEDDANVSVSTFTMLRDYLMLRLLLSSAQRPGAIANLTEQEFMTGNWDYSTDIARYLTYTVRHKPSASDVAALFWDSELLKMGRLYHQKLRPLFYRKDSSTYGGPRSTERGQPFFLTMFGGSLSGREVSNRVKSMAKRLHPGMKGNLQGTRFRKFVVLSHRQDADPAVSADLLAKHMTHSRETADSYFVNRGFPEQGKGAEYLKTVQRPPTCTITRPRSSAVETATTSDSSRGIAPHPPSPVPGSSQPSPPPNPRPKIPPDPSHHISVPQKKELLHLFATHLSNGVCPDTAMVSSTIKFYPSVRNLDPSTAQCYLAARVMSKPSSTTTTITTETIMEERQAWVAARRPTVSGPSQAGLRLFTQSQSAALEKATSNLTSSAYLADIIAELSADNDCRTLGMYPQEEGGSFTRQQLRDKFKSLRKRLDRHRK